MKDKIVSLMKKKRTWFLLVSFLSAFGVSVSPEVANSLVDFLPEIVTTFLE